VSFEQSLLIAVYPILEDVAQQLLAHLGWHGVAMVEFKYDPETKKYWLMEVNPRFWGSLALAIASGVDFPWLLYCLATDGDVEPVFQYRIGITARWLLGDMLAFIDCFKKYKSKIHLLKDFIFCKDSTYDDFHWDDPLPFVVESLYYFSKFLKTRSRNPVDEAMLILN
jgi:predicted ATP-grasp superfamily ATP-dependent carboligase